MTTDLLIHALGPKGDGVHQSDRGTVFIDRALPGDRVQAEARKAAGGVLRAEITHLVTPSPHRVAAPCPHYDVCGGCTLQHATDAFYKNWKVEIVKDALAKKNLSPALWHDPVFVPPGTRRRVTFAALKKSKVVTLGYSRRRTHAITDITTCLVAEPAIMTLRAALSAHMAPLLQEGKPAGVFIQTINGQSDVVMTGPMGAKGTPDLRVYEALAAFAHTLKVSRFSWRAREHDTPEVMIELNPVRTTFGPLDVALPSLAFLQPTKAGENALVAAVMKSLPKAGTFADLFSGCGTFSGPMLARGAVDAFENAEGAVRALDKAKSGKPLKAQMRDLFRRPLLPTELKRYDALVFDPPRAGAEEQAKMLATSTVPVLIGVSCNPTTFARDARLLVDGGYTFETVQVIDQFTWSHHVELVATFTKRA